MDHYKLYARLIRTGDGASVNGTIIVEAIDPRLDVPGCQRRGKALCEDACHERAAIIL
jgi:hypothetical protein